MRLNTYLFKQSVSKIAFQSHGITELWPESWNNFGTFEDKSNEHFALDHYLVPFSLLWLSSRSYAIVRT